MAYERRRSWAAWGLAPGRAGRGDPLSRARLVRRASRPRHTRRRKPLAGEVHRRGCEDREQLDAAYPVQLRGSGPAPGDLPWYAGGVCEERRVVESAARGKRKGRIGRRSGAGRFDPGWRSAAEAGGLRGVAVWWLDRGGLAPGGGGAVDRAARRPSAPERSSDYKAHGDRTGASPSNARHELAARIRLRRCRARAGATGASRAV